MGNCLKLIDMVIPHASVNWERNDKEFSLQNFKESYEHYCGALVGSANDIGIVQSWFQFYQNIISDGHCIVINSFGMDVRSTILKTVKDEREVLHVAVNFSKWTPKDVASFDKIYELSDFGREKG